MKKTLKIFGAVAFLSMFLTSCGPDPCDCLKEYESPFWTPGKTRFFLECREKYGKDIPESYKGTDQYHAEMVRILRRECNK